MTVAMQPVADFRGLIPAKYDENLGPVLFRPFAMDLVQRIPPLPSHKASVLEIACGTGQLTRLLRGALPPSVPLTAIDLSDSMLLQAQTLHGNLHGVEWLQDDMADLHCPNGCYDAVFCQFGAMFCEDKQTVFQEACRVLKHGGRFIFNVWDSLRYNDLSRAADETLRAEFPDDPPSFYETPYGFNDHRAIRAGLARAGFNAIEIETVHKPCIAPSAHQVAEGLIDGTPVAAALRNRGVDDTSAIVMRLEAEIARRWGDHPVRCNMQAIVCTAHRP